MSCPCAFLVYVTTLLRAAVALGDLSGDQLPRRRVALRSYGRWGTARTEHPRLVTDLSGALRRALRRALAARVLLAVFLLLVARVLLVDVEMTDGVASFAACASG